VRLTEVDYESVFVVAVFAGLTGAFLYWNFLIVTLMLQ